MQEYKIVSVMPTVDLTPDGRFRKIYRIKFEYKGIVDFIDVTEEEYLTGKYKEKIEKIIKAHEEALR